MKKTMQITLSLLLGLALTHHADAQKTDSTGKVKDNTPHVYFIIDAGTEINAFFNDKPLQLSTADEFDKYVQANVKNMKDSWVVVTGKPKTGTYDEVMKTLKRNRFKHISSSIVN